MARKRWHVENMIYLRGPILVPGLIFFGVLYFGR